MYFLHYYQIFPETNITTKVGIYSQYWMTAYGRCICISVQHIRSLALTMQQGALYTQLTYITEQIWLPHCKYNSHNQHALRLYRPNIFAHICQNTTSCNRYFTGYFLIFATNKYVHQICQYTKYMISIYGAYMCNIRSDRHQPCKRNTVHRWCHCHHWQWWWWWYWYISTTDITAELKWPHFYLLSLQLSWSL